MNKPTTAASFTLQDYFRQASPLNQAILLQWQPTDSLEVIELVERGGIAPPASRILNKPKQHRLP